MILDITVIFIMPCCFLSNTTKSEVKLLKLWRPQMNRLILISSMCLSLFRNSLKNTKMLRMAHGMMILYLLVVSLKFVCLVGWLSLYFNHKKESIIIEPAALIKLCSPGIFQSYDKHDSWLVSKEKRKRIPKELPSRSIFHLLTADTGKLEILVIFS